MMLMSELRKGDYVVWRSTSGVTHFAAILRVNKLTVRIRVLDNRGDYELSVKSTSLEKAEVAK